MSLERKMTRDELLEHYKRARAALEEAYALMTGKQAAWSSAFDYVAALEAIDAQHAALQAQVRDLQRIIECMTETAGENSRIKIEDHNRITDLQSRLEKAEAYPIKCIWCGLKMATVDEAAEHVLACDKGPWVGLLRDNASLQSMLEEAERSLREHRCEVGLEDPDAMAAHLAAIPPSERAAMNRVIQEGIDRRKKMLDHKANADRLAEALEEARKCFGQIANDDYPGCEYRNGYLSFASECAGAIEDCLRLHREGR